MYICDAFRSYVANTAAGGEGSWYPWNVEIQWNHGLIKGTPARNKGRSQTTDYIFSYSYFLP